MQEHNIHPNIIELKAMVEKYGSEAVISATGYTMGSLLQYTRPNGKVIPDKRLDIARKLLAATDK